MLHTQVTVYANGLLVAWPNENLEWRPWEDTPEHRVIREGLWAPPEDLAGVAEADVRWQEGAYAMEVGGPRPLVQQASRRLLLGLLAGGCALGLAGTVAAAAYGSKA